MSKEGEVVQAKKSFMGMPVSFLPAPYLNRATTRSTNIHCCTKHPKAIASILRTVAQWHWSLFRISGLEVWAGRCCRVRYQ